jgi:uncharacterized membrane protein
VVKLPFLLSDLGTALLLRELVAGWTGNSHLGVKAAGLWFLNPYLIWISAGWGHFDTMPAFFTVAALLLLSRKKIALSSIALAISIGYKLYPILFIPAAVIYLLKSREGSGRAVDALKFLGIQVILGVLLIAVVPEVWRLPSMILHGGVVATLSTGLTYWSLGLVVPIRFEDVIYISLAIFPIILFVVYVKVARAYTDHLLALCAVQLGSLLALFLSYPLIPEQFFVWALPLAAILIVHRRVEPALYNAASLLALGYAITNVALPLYFLPLSPWIGDELAWLMRVIQPYRVRAVSDPTIAVGVTVGGIILAILGVVFSALLVMMLLETLSKRNLALARRVFPSRLYLFLDRSLEESA